MLPEGYYYYVVRVLKALKKKKGFMYVNLSSTLEICLSLFQTIFIIQKKFKLMSVLYRTCLDFEFVL